VAIATSQLSIRLGKSIMGNAFRRCLGAAVCLSVGFSALPPAMAQHHGGHHSSHHGGHHGSWLHVVPSHHHHHSGLYYSYGGANYYTPVSPPVQVQVMRPQADGTPLPIAPPGELIAPQSVKLEFGGFRQTNDLSGRLVFEANRWCLDMHYNYRHNPDFEVTYRDAYRVLLAARNVQGATQETDREAIRTELTAVEPLFHGVQEKVKTWSREERRPVGADGINEKTQIVESILHHLLFDVGVEEQHAAAPEEQAPPPSELPAPRGVGQP